jgi:hypothetical protein
MSYIDNPYSLHICVECESEYRIKPIFIEDQGVIKFCPYCAAELPHEDPED